MFEISISATLSLLFLMVVGFLLVRLKVLQGDSATRVLSRLETFVFMPALKLSVLGKDLSLDRLVASRYLLLCSAVFFLCVAGLTLLLARLFGKDDYTRRVYTFCFTLSNFGFFGNAVIQAVFPDYLADYLLFSAVVDVGMYGWAVPSLLLVDGGEKITLKKRLQNTFNPIMIGMIVGIILGVTGLGSRLPSFVSKPIDMLSSCMSTVAMVLAGMSIASLPLGNVLKTVRVYLAALVRLAFIPGLFLTLGLVLQHFLGEDVISNVFIVCMLTFTALPTSISAITIPRAYDKDVTQASGLAFISHLLAIITVPVFYIILDYFIH